MTVIEAADVVHRCYPQVYHACHTRHGRARSRADRLSDRDVQILVHLDRARPMTVSELAAHLGLAKSTVSEALTALVDLAYVRKARRDERDRRRVALALTDQGLAAIRRSSVLESRRLHAVLRRLSAPERASVAHGLALLARACQPRRTAAARQRPTSAVPARGAR
ncbi:MAG: MarR family transcriptional regulator [Vicinamibacterales bacterium]